jgi:hypothetical protein
MPQGTLFTEDFLNEGHPWHGGLAQSIVRHADPARLNEPQTEERIIRLPRGGAVSWGLPCLPTLVGMGRDRGEQPTTRLRRFRDGSSSPTSPIPATQPAADASLHRHVLPKNLRKAVKHLSDGELDLLHAATLVEMGEEPSIADANSPSDL